MIINTITLHNFMSYSDAKLDLSSVTVACLAGHNGAGKSAILDAITWACWESARSSSDELVRLGEKEMWVEVCFTLESQTYRVKRLRQRNMGKAGGRAFSKSMLDLQIKTNDGWLPLTASSIKETQKQINDLLRMDYDTFTNSVYLRQGRADEFTTKTSAERKQILGEVLGLSYFDQLSDLAREKVRQLRTYEQVLTFELNKLPALEAELESLRNEALKHQEEVEQAVNQESFYDSQYRQLQSNLQERQLIKQRWESGLTRKTELIAELNEFDIKEKELAKKVGELAKLIADSAEIENEVEQFQDLKKQVEILDQNGLAWQEFMGKRLELQSELTNLNNRMEMELNQVKSNCAELEEKQKQLIHDTRESNKLQAGYKQFKEMLTQESTLSVKQETFTKLMQRVNELKTLIQEVKIHLQAEIQQKELQVNELKQSIDKSTNIDEEKGLLDKQAQELDKLETEYALVEQNGIKIKSDLETIVLTIKELQSRSLEDQNKIKELTEHSNSNVCPLCAAPIVDRLAVINRYKQQIAKYDQEISSLTVKSECLESERLDLRHKYTELKQKLEGRKRLDVQIGQFNEKVATLVQVKANYQEMQAKSNELKEHLEKDNFAHLEKESLANIQAEIEKLEFDPALYANLQAQIRAQRYVETRYQQIQRDILELEKINLELPKLKQKSNQITQQLQDGSYCQDLQKKLNALEEKIQELNYDRNYHQELKSKLSERMPVLEKKLTLQRAHGDKLSMTESLTACRLMIASKQEQLNKLAMEIDTWEKLVNELPQLQTKLVEMETALTKWRTQKDLCAQQAAITSSRLDQLKQEMTKLNDKKNELKGNSMSIEDHQAIAEAFGKKGLQAAIIENAIPEIESEANRLLSRLSENQMHVALVTQHKTKSGTTVETLDILIGDEFGTRNYELYSGGEAFKVNFALRVALSKLLANRAGAKLETLIIDEGFGSQDELSRERLVKAIGSIQNDFAKILAITHINEIKEMFPTHIYVSKSHGESHISVV